MLAFDPTDVRVQRAENSERVQGSLYAISREDGTAWFGLCETARVGDVQVAAHFEESSDPIFAQL